MEEIGNLIEKFKIEDSVKELKSKLNEKNFLDIMSISRKETSHSSFICWLLNYKENYDLSVFPLKLFLKLILETDNNNSEINEELKGYLLNELNETSLKIGVQLSDLETERKVGKNGRIDIMLKFFIEYKGFNNKQCFDYVNILIENKVKSKEHDSQTLKYEKYICKVPINTKKFVTNKKGIVLFVYLSPLKEKEYSPKSKKFIHLSYQELLDNLIQPSYDKSENERVKLILQEYISNLGITNKKVMALSSNDKVLLENFWNKNYGFFESILNASLINDDFNDEFIEKINVLKNNLEFHKSNHTLIKLLFENKLSKDAFRMSNIGYYTVLLLKEKDLLNEEVINFLKEDKSCSYQLIKTKDEINFESSEDKKYRHNDSPELIYKNEEYYIARNWGKVNGIDNTLNFIEKIQAKFPKIKFERNK